MTSPGRNLLALFAALMLSACGLFGDEDEELKPAELIDFETKVKIKRITVTTMSPQLRTSRRTKPRKRRTRCRQSAA